MFDALELIFEAVQKVAQAQQRQAGGDVPPQPAVPPRSGAPRAPQMGVPAPVRPKPVAAPAVAMGRIPDAVPFDTLAPLEPLEPLVPLAGAPAFSNPLLDALRGGPALIGGIVVAQVLGPPAALRPHSAPTDTL